MTTYVINNDQNRLSTRRLFWEIQDVIGDLTEVTQSSATFSKTLSTQQELQLHEIVAQHTPFEKRLSKNYRRTEFDESRKIDVIEYYNSFENGVHQGLCTRMKHNYSDTALTSIDVTEYFADGAVADRTVVEYHIENIQTELGVRQVRTSPYFPGGFNA